MATFSYIFNGVFSVLATLAPDRGADLFIQLRRLPIIQSNLQYMADTLAAAAARLLRETAQDG